MIHSYGVTAAPQRRAPRTYNEVAGSNRARLEAISDGIFAVGMTLLVLFLALPAADLVHSEADLLRQLRDLLPAVVTYFMSFLTLGIFWVGQQTQLSKTERVDRLYTWIHLGFLLTVTMVPFTTALLARFHWSRVALVIYWLNILAMGLVLLAGIEYGLHKRLYAEEHRESVARFFRRRVYGAQALYLVAMLLSIIDVHVSIAAFVLIQLNFVLAPPIPFLRSI